MAGISPQQVVFVSLILTLKRTYLLSNCSLLNLQIQNSDDVVVGVPNSQLTGQRVYNLSRTPQSQVKQTLRIRYEDASKIPLLLETIKEEITNDCDKLIPGRLRAHWSNFEDDHLQVVVDAHFSIKPTGNEYHDNRQKVLQAIYRAVKKTGVNFEKSSSVCA